MAKKFYYRHLPRCDVHKIKAAGYEVLSRGERYRWACDEKCAKKQVEDLEKAWVE